VPNVSNFRILPVASRHYAHTDSILISDVNESRILIFHFISGEGQTQPLY